MSLGPVGSDPSSTRSTQSTQAADDAKPAAQPAAQATTPTTPGCDAKKPAGQDVVDGARAAVKGAEDAIKQRLQNFFGGNGIEGQQVAGGTGKKGTRGGIRTVMNNDPNRGNVA